MEVFHQVAPEEFRFLVGVRKALQTSSQLKKAF